MTKYLLTDFLIWLEKNNKKKDQLSPNEWKEFTRIEKYGKFFTDICQFLVGEITHEQLPKPSHLHDEIFKDQPPCPSDSYYAKHFLLVRTLDSEIREWLTQEYAIKFCVVCNRTIQTELTHHPSCIKYNSRTDCIPEENYQEEQKKKPVLIGLLILLTLILTIYLLN